MKSAALSCILFLLFLGYGLAQQKNVYEHLWNTNIDLANMTLHTDFLVQMQSGSLQAERYVNFTLQDINYLLNVTELLKKMSLKDKIPKDLKDFMKNRYTSYKNFANDILGQYFLKGELPIKPTPAMKKYMSDYKTVMRESDPVYFAVALLPCSRLWVWLADNLVIPTTNAYYTWKKGNMGGHPEKHYKALLNKYLDTPEKVQKAKTIFRTQMQNEHDFFNTS